MARQVWFTCQLEGQLWGDKKERQVSRQTAIMKAGLNKDTSENACKIAVHVYANKADSLYEK